MIVVTGAGGQLGRLVVRGLIDVVAPGTVVAATRQPERLADLAARGVEIRHADYDEPATLASAIAGAERLLMVSGDAVGRRAAQHKAVAEAAAAAGVGRIVYTSVLHASTSPLIVAPDHKASEDAVRASGLPFTFLRNGWYTENYGQTVRSAAESGVIIGSAGDGRVASAARADYAAAAVAVLTMAGEPEPVYELSGDVAWSYPELAEEVAGISGRPVAYRDVPAEEHRAALIEAGLPEPVADVYVSFDRDIRRGALASTSGSLRTLIGRPTTTLRDSVAAELAS
ncbi:MAG: NmrA family NAD(P)-binding protein [Labedaea sp.]